MNEIARELRAAQSGLLTSAQALGSLADLLTRQDDPEPQDPPPGNTWEREHTMTGGDTSRTFIIAQDLDRISSVRVTLWITPSQPAPDHGGELAVIAPCADGKPVFRDGLLEVRYTASGRGLRIISGPGLKRDQKLRFEIPGQLRVDDGETMVVEVHLGVGPGRLGVGPGRLTYGNGYEAGARDLPEAALRSVRGPLALHVGGLPGDLWEGTRIKARVEVLG